MTCSLCKHDNSDLAFFCSQCGAALNSGQEAQCNKCGARNAPGQGFCSACGDDPEASNRPADPQLAVRVPFTPAHLVQRILAEKQALESRGVPEGERKTVTALFSDIKGSTDLMQDLDPDEALAIVDPALQLMMEAVHQYEGYVVQCQGDGIFALFGAPIANEDHALRAIRAALLMQEKIAGYRDQLTIQGKPALQIRVGLNTGEMVLRSIRRDDLQLDYNAIGHSINLAARIQTFASPDGVAVGEETFKLADGFFDFRSLGPKQVKGVREPVEIREVTGGNEQLRTRFDVSERRGLTGFVGREKEFALLDDAMRRVLSGRGQVVALVGEPGVGKSRLFHEFKLSLGQGWHVLQTACVSYARSFPFAPLRELLSNYFDLAAEDPDTVRHQKVLAKCISLDSNLEESTPYICSLLGISGLQAATLQQVGPDLRRRRMFEAIDLLFSRMSSAMPVALIFEDMQWTDVETEEFLVAFGQRLAAYQILLLVNYRSEYKHRWKGFSNFTEISISPLTSAATEALLRSILGDGPKLVSIKRAITDLTEGNPFFVEELLRGLFERGVLQHQNDGGVSVIAALVGQLSTMKVPNTVQGVLASRIDALGVPEKELLQRLSVLGREFSLNLVEAFGERAEGELEEQLEQLEHSGFVYSADSTATSAFMFKHSLTQQVAYSSIPAERRKLLEGRAGSAIERVFANRLQDHYAELAYHYGRSANLDKAIEYLSLGGDQAAQIGAFPAAMVQFESGLKLLEALPSTPLREAKELSLRFSRANALWMSRGPASPEVPGELKRALALIGPNSDPMQTFLVLRSSVQVSCNRAEYVDALQHCERLISFAHQLDFPVFNLLSFFTRSNVRLLVGELSSAQRDFEEAIALYDPLRSVLPLPATNLALISLATYGPLLCILGYPDRALRISEDTIVAARSPGTKYLLPYVTYFAGFVRLMRGDVVGARQRADESITLAAEVGFPTVLAAANVLRGWSLAHAGQFEESVKMIREGIVEFERTTGKVWHATLNGILLDVLVRARRLEEASELADESIRFVDLSGERLTLPELWRLKGNICLSRPANDLIEAEACFRRSVEIARAQDARFFELRGAKALASLACKNGQRGEVRVMLADMYGWFTEGFDTADLKESKALLVKLGA
jgi:class 3 adenylate cyclase